MKTLVEAVNLEVLAGSERFKKSLTLLWREVVHLGVEYLLQVKPLPLPDIWSQNLVILSHKQYGRTFPPPIWQWGRCLSVFFSCNCSQLLLQLSTVMRTVWRTSVCVQLSVEIFFISPFLSCQIYDLTPAQLKSQTGTTPPPPPRGTQSWDKRLKICKTPEM